MTGDPITLHEGFAAPDLEAWRRRARASLGDAAPVGDSLAPLVRRTLDGLARGPLATRADRPPAVAPLSPQSAPDNRPPVSASQPADANAEALEALMGEAGSLELRVDPAGAAGVAIRTAADLERALADVDLEAAGLSLDASDAAAARLLVDFWSKRDLASNRLRAALNLDPLGAAARMGSVAGLEKAWDEAARLAGEIDAPSITALRIDARLVHEAGGTEAQELAWAAACAVAALEAMTDRGLATERAARALALAVALDADLHLGIAKLRALGILWRRIASASGAGNFQTVVQAFSSRRMLSRRDAETNLLRLTAAATAAALGGAGSVTLEPYSFAAGRSTPLSRRLSRNIPILLAEEAGLGGLDPARGSFHHEAMAAALAEAAWAGFQGIMRAGGAAAWIASGRLAADVAEARARRADRIARRLDPLVGISDYVDPGEQTAEPRPAPAPGPLAPIRLAEPFEALRDAADAWARRKGRRPDVPIVLDGDPMAAAPQAAWARRLLAAGGLETLGSEAATSRAAVVCGARGVRLVLDGRETALADGEDLLDALRAIHRALGIAS